MNYNRTLHLLIAALLIATSFQAVAYDEKVARFFAGASMASYCSPDVLDSLSCGDACKQLTGYKFLHQLSVQIAATQAVSYSLFVNPSIGRLVAAFRGTNNVPQLLSESLDSRGVPCLVCTNPKSLAESYFHNAYYNNLHTDFLNQVHKVLQTVPVSDLYITGHSLGGALATVATLDAAKNKLLPTQNLHLYTFGSPRVGNTFLVNEVLSSVNEAFRIVHYQDVVPHVPPCVQDQAGICQETALYDETNAAVFHAWHVRPEVFYNENQDSYRICQDSEDPKCSDQFIYAQGTITDHLNYLGITNTCATAQDFVTKMLVQQKEGKSHKSR